MEVKVMSSLNVDDPLEDRLIVSATISPLQFIEKYSESRIMDEICSRIAEKFVADHYAEIAAKLDSQAIANLSIADAGKKIAEAISARPVVYRERGDTTNNYSLF